MGRFQDFCLNRSVGCLSVTLTRLCAAVAIEGGSRQTHLETHFYSWGLQEHPFQGGKCTQGGWLPGLGQRTWQPWMKGSRGKKKTREGRKEGEGSCHRLKAFEEHSGSEPGSGGRPPGSTSCLRHILSQWPCRTGSTTPAFAVFICEVRVIMTPASELCCLRSYPSSAWRSA